MNPAILSMLERYKCLTASDHENALKEIMQELALLGLWRSKFFEHAAFYGGTALRILYGLNRFSEDLDFSLLQPNGNFSLSPHLKAIAAELNGMGFEATVEPKQKKVDTAIESAFIKAGTKAHLIKIKAQEEVADRVPKNQVLSIKIELDTDPPLGFETEAKVILQPIPFAVRTYQEPDLFAGKIHAILQRNWKESRVKGRDYYDFVWYIGRRVPARLSHLEARLRQSGGWTARTALGHAELLDLLQTKFAAVSIDAAKKDVLPFLRDAAAVELWSNEFFISLLPQLKTC